MVESDSVDKSNGENTAQIGVTGLAVMGRNLARNLASKGHSVAVHNRSPERTRELVTQFGHEGTFVPAESLAELVASLQRPRTVIIMVQAGAGTDAVIESLIPLLEAGDIVVDGGNAHYPDTIQREARLAEQGMHFVGAGISGGEEGALNGPSIMPGGSAQAYASVGPILETIAAQVDGTPCCTHVGTDGAGHFVKMVHNGIEYADMQLIAESYDLMRRGLGMAPQAIAETFREWNAGELSSYLVEITAQVLAHNDPQTGEALVDVIADAAEQKGTGRWTVRSALELGVPVTGIGEAVFARALSGHTEQRVSAMELPGPRAEDGPALGAEERSEMLENIRRALYAAKLVAYAQGFDQLGAGSAEHSWNLDRGALATIWRGGCIIRAAFLDRVREAYRQHPDLASLLLADTFAAPMRDYQAAWRQVVATAVHLGVPTPGFSTALAYYDGLRAQRSPAALIQGLRDYFGAHTYRRTDREGVFHTRWAQDGAEERHD